MKTRFFYLPKDGYVCGVKYCKGHIFQSYTAPKPGQVDGEQYTEDNVPEKMRGIPWIVVDLNDVPKSDCYSDLYYDESTGKIVCDTTRRCKIEDASCALSKLVKKETADMTPDAYAAHKRECEEKKASVKKMYAAQKESEREWLEKYGNEWNSFGAVRRPRKDGAVVVKNTKE